MPETHALDPVALLNVDDELGRVASELRVVMLAVDSRALEADRAQVSGLLAILDRQIDSISKVRVCLRPDRGGDDDEADNDADVGEEG